DYTVSVQGIHCNRTADNWKSVPDYPLLAHLLLA
ncbi:hypothetical protein F441_18127, partial [Phytophthora nicotianae CJ01A1]